MKLISAGIAFFLAFTCQARIVLPGKCALKNCRLTAPVASEGPGFPDGIRFFQLDLDGADHRAACPIGPDNPDEKEWSRKEHLRYLKQMNDVAAMSREEQIAYAIEQRKKDEARWAKMGAEPEKAKEPRVDVTKPGAHAVNYSTFSELRAKNEYDFLVVFYAPWCPHCKAFVLAGEDAPINALGTDLEKANGPKVLTFDVIAHDPPHTIDAVPTVFLYTKDGRALVYKSDIHNAQALRDFALQLQEDKKLLFAQQAVSQTAQTTVRPWLCPVENCVLKSSLALAGPGFQDGVNSATAGNNRSCPLAGQTEEGDSLKREWLGYSKGLHKVEVPAIRAHAAQTVARPSVDVTKPGVESVDSMTWAELRSANEYDFLVTFFAPWCGHCKALVLADDAPLKELRAKLEKAHGPKVVSFDVVADDPPLVVNSVPEVYLYPKGGQAIRFEGDPANVPELLAWTLENASPREHKLLQVKQHLRKA